MIHLGMEISPSSIATAIYEFQTQIWKNIIFVASYRLFYLSVWWSIFFSASIVFIFLFCDDKFLPF